MDLSLQVKILRVLQEKEFERVGAIRTQKVNVRIVAATNRDLEAEVAAMRFREDLFYRLNVIPMHLPPLRDRGQDIMILADHFTAKFCERKGRKKFYLSSEAADMFLRYSWPGNVRELENFMERLAILCDAEVIGPDDLPQKIWNDLGRERRRDEASPAPVAAGFVWPVLSDIHSKGMGLKEFIDEIEERLLREALDKSGGVKNQAAELLGIKRTTLIEKLKKKNMAQV